MIEVDDSEIVEQPRKDWKEAFQKIADSEDDKLLETPSSDWDKAEWEWV